MPLRLLLLNPPVYDFTAYDFWLKPYGLLRVAGQLRGQAEMQLFDFLDRQDARMPNAEGRREDSWGRGEYYREDVPAPFPLAGIPRRYHRFGVPRRGFREFLAQAGPFDVALIQTGMTYWYPGVQEVLADLRELAPHTRTVLGGPYATLCPEHARRLGAGLLVRGGDLPPLWEFLHVQPDRDGLPYWEAYSRLNVGVIKLADGCRFRCTYCAVPFAYPGFQARPRAQVLAELDLLLQHGARQIAFYDDALLYRAEEVLEPFLHGALARGAPVAFHTPNALHVRFMSSALARLLVRAGFQSFYLGFESRFDEFQRQTGGKAQAEEFAAAVGHLRDAGVEPEQITAYLIFAHPRGTPAELEASLHFAHDLGVRVMLSEFSPLPGTPDGDLAARWVDLSEPLLHNKTAFPILCWGQAEVRRLKDLCRRLNEALRAQPVSS